MHPDDDDNINCGECRDTGRIVYGRTDAESVDEDNCPYCAAGRRRAAALRGQAQPSLEWPLRRSLSEVA